MAGVLKPAAPAAKVAEVKVVAAPVKPLRPAAEIVYEWWSEVQSSAPKRSELDLAVHVERKLGALVEALSGPAPR